jgi:uncharacterized protein
VERLTAREGRVVASLVEKQLTIPQHYPLTLHALVAACNQSSSRDPVTSYGEDEVLEAVESLKARRMARAVLPSHGRSAVRYRHVLDEAFGLDAPQLAVLAVLDLRGPQTVAELRSRTERMAPIASVDHELELLATREDPLAERLARQPGQKEDRWASLLAEPLPTSAVARDVEDHTPPGGGRAVAAGDLRADVQRLGQDLAALRAELASLRVAVDDLRAGLEDLRSSLGG